MGRRKVCIQLSMLQIGPTKPQDTSNSDMKEVALNFRSANERCEGGLNPVILFNANHPGM